MNFITHSLLPVTIRQTAELVSHKDRDYTTQWKHWVVIAIFGTLPDLVDFHMTLGQRWHSFSHQWIMTTSVFAAGWLCYFLFRKWSWSRVAPWCALAYVLHIPCDLVSGGLDFLGTGRVTGDWWISFSVWPILDIGFILLFVIYHRRIRKRHGLEASLIKTLRARNHKAGGQ